MRVVRKKVDKGKTKVAIKSFYSTRSLRGYLYLIKSITYLHLSTKVFQFE